jgi:hypothetical protein
MTVLTRQPICSIRDVNEKLTAFRFLKDNDNVPSLFNTESGVLVHVSINLFENPSSKTLTAENAEK